MFVNDILLVYMLLTGKDLAKTAGVRGLLRTALALVAFSGVESKTIVASVSGSQKRHHGEFGFEDSPRTGQFGNQFRYKAQIDPALKKTHEIKPHPVIPRDGLMTFFLSQNNQPRKGSEAGRSKIAPTTCPGRSKIRCKENPW